MNSSISILGDMPVHLCLSATALIVGLVCNLFVISSIRMKRTPCSRTHICVVNLAIADMIVLSLCMPLNFVGMYISWPFGRFVCKVLFPITDTVLAVSNITLVLIGLDRYRAVVTPLARKPTLHETRISVTLVWIVSYLITSLPLTLMMNIGPGIWTKTSCDVIWPAKWVENGYKLTNFILLFCVPVVLNLVFYTRIAYKLEKNARNFRSRNEFSERHRYHRRLVFMMFLMFVCFVACMVPYHLLMLLTTFGKDMMTRWRTARTAVWASVLLLYTSSSINPIIYMIMSKEFHHFFRLKILKPIVSTYCSITWHCLGFKTKASTSSNHEIPLEDRYSMHHQPDQPQLRLVDTPL